MISFKANLVSRTTVQKLDSNNNPLFHNVAFVELQPVSLRDKKTLDELARLWCGTEDSFASSIREDFKDVYKQGNPNKRFFALTEQSGKFEKLDTLYILGLMEITQHTFKKFWIDYLQVAPDFCYSVKDRRMQHIGKSMIESLKKLLPDKNLYLDPVSTAKKFYEKQGFSFINGLSMAFKPKS